MAVLSPNQLGICSWSLHCQTPKQLAIEVNELGLKQIQLHLNSCFDNPDVWGNAKLILLDQGITIASGMFSTLNEDYSTLESIRKTGGIVPDETWEANWQTAQKSADIAQKMNVKLVTMHAGFLPHDETDPAFEKIAGRILKIAQCFDEHGILLTFETGQELANTLTKFLDYLHHNGSQNVGVNFDPANMILYAMGDPIDSLKKLLPHVRQCHIKDATKSPVKGQWGKEVPIGDGEVDWQTFMQVLAEAKFEGPLIIEREAGEQRQTDIRTAISRMQALMP